MAKSQREELKGSADFVFSEHQIKTTCSLCLKMQSPSFLCSQELYSTTLECERSDAGYCQVQILFICLKTPVFLSGQHCEENRLHRHISPCVSLFCKLMLHFSRFPLRWQLDEHLVMKTQRSDNPGLCSLGRPSSVRREMGRKDACRVHLCFLQEKFKPVLTQNRFFFSTSQEFRQHVWARIFPIYLFF